VSQSLNLSLRPSFLDRDRELIINSELIQFDDTELKDSNPTLIPKSEISDFRYGIKRIRGYMFYIGTIFCIDVRGINNQIIKLRLKSLYGIGRKNIFKKYSAVINALYANYFDEVIVKYLNKFENGDEFEIAEVVFKFNGVIFRKKTELIEWKNLGTKTYFSYYALYDQQQPDNYKAFEYVNDWNIGILYSVTQQILKNKCFNQV
jgi:hypothetical protein